MVETKIHEEEKTMPDSVHILIVSTSLNPTSRSRALGQYALSVLRERGQSVEMVDLRELEEIPHAGSPKGWEPHTGLDFLKERMQAATHILFAVPVYNFAGSAAAKNIVELVGEKELGGKTVGFLCAASGPRGYMSILPLANSLMLDFRCWIVPRFVYATGDDVKDGEVASKDIRHRIEQLTAEMLERIPAPPTT
jgi:FMN reductase